MTVEQIKTFLNNSLDINDAPLKEAIVNYVVEKGYKEEYQNWEQLRFVKHEMDSLWAKLKKCSEQKIVKERIQQMIAAFPRPTQL